MLYYSTNKQSPLANFKEATILGQAPDQGLYFPQHIPRISTEIIKNLRHISRTDIAFQVIKPYVGNTISAEVLQAIVTETIDFDIPIVAIDESISTLELFHGPTLAFKDVGARFMSRCLGYFAKERSERIIVLVATSGDTGGAVANGFYNVPGVDVVILYPSGKVSAVQEKQLTTLGNNIHALEVEGNFDDCQRMVKLVFADDIITKQFFLTSANSINIARWLPQQFYYFFALQQWQHADRPPVISVPSGNFGNICAGLLAYKSGLPVKHFIAACNANDVVHKYMLTEDYKPKQAVATISNAMDVGNPSNFIRILEIFHHHFPELKAMLSSYSISDDETKDTIKKVYDRTNYVLDPHGAVAYVALERYLHENTGEQGFFLETAHPIKFNDSIEAILDKKIDIPAHVQAIMQANKVSEHLPPCFEALKEWLQKTF